MSILPGRGIEGAETKKTIVVLKSKVDQVEGLKKLLEWHNDQSPELGKMFQSLYLEHDIKYDLHLVEQKMAALRKGEAVLASISPEVYYTESDIEKNRYVIVTEYLGPKEYTHIDSYPGGNGHDVWEDCHIRCVLADIARLHASFLGRTEAFTNVCPPVVTFTDVAERTQSKFHIRQLQHFRCRHPEIYTENRVRFIERAFRNIDKVYTILDKSNKTLTHSDFSPRNVCLRKYPNSAGRYLCAFDWEHVKVNVPQRDVIEFLAYVLPQDVFTKRHLEHVEFYREKLYSALVLESEQFATESTRSEKFYETYNMCAIQFVFSVLPILEIFSTNSADELRFALFKNVANNVLGYMESTSLNCTYLK